MYKYLSYILLTIVEQLRSIVIVMQCWRAPRGRARPRAAACAKDRARRAGTWTKHARHASRARRTRPSAPAPLPSPSRVPHPVDERTRSCSFERALVGARLGRVRCVRQRKSTPSGNARVRPNGSRDGAAVGEFRLLHRVTRILRDALSSAVRAPSVERHRGRSGAVGWAAARLQQNRDRSRKAENRVVCAAVLTRPFTSAEGRQALQGAVSRMCLFSVSLRLLPCDALGNISA